MQKVKHCILTVISVCCLLTSAVCVICNYCIAHCLSWSLIVILSLAVGWTISFTALTAEKHHVRKLLFVISALSFPFLWILALLLNRPKIGGLGSCIALLSVASIWAVYGISTKCGNRIFRTIGFALLITIPLSLGITHLVYLFNEMVYTDIFSDVFHVLISLILAGSSFLSDYIINKAKVQ